jgi:hypothetical protein
LAREASHEWGRLKSLVFKFAFDKQGFGDKKFTWTRVAAQPHLCLGKVTVSFSDRPKRGGLQDCKALFCCNDQRAGNSGLSNHSWSLDPEIVMGAFAWTVREKGCSFTSGELAEEIASELIRCHLTYERQARQAV